MLIPPPKIFLQKILPSRTGRVMRPLILPQEFLPSEQGEGDDAANFARGKFILFSERAYNPAIVFFTKINQKINVGV